MAGDQNERVTEATPESDLRAQLNRLAVRFVLPGRLPDVDQAIRLACELIARDLDTPATISVAALSYGTTLRDSEPMIRDMLSEQRVPLPGDDATEPERFNFVLRAFASGGLSVGDMSAALFRVPWEDQTEVQRALLRLTIDLDQETSPTGKAAIVATMRAIAGGPADDSQGAGGWERYELSRPACRWRGSYGGTASPSWPSVRCNLAR